MSIPGRDRLFLCTGGRGLSEALARLSWLPVIISHKNMSAIYSNSTLIPPGSSVSTTDLDTSRHDFDVYEAYQRALADEQVSPPCSSNLKRRRVLIQESRYLRL